MGLPARKSAEAQAGYVARRDAAPAAAAALLAAGYGGDVTWHDNAGLSHQVNNCAMQIAANGENGTPQPSEELDAAAAKLTAGKNCGWGKHYSTGVLRCVDLINLYAQ